MQHSDRSHRAKCAVQHGRAAAEGRFERLSGKREQALLQDQAALRTKCTRTVLNSLLRLWKILRVIWRMGRIPEQWRVAEGVWIPK